MTSTNATLRAEHLDLWAVLDAADSSGFTVESMELSYPQRDIAGSGSRDVEVKLVGDYGLELTLRGSARRVAAHLYRIHTLGSSYELKPR